MDTKQPGPITRFILSFVGIAVGAMAMILAVAALIKVILFCVKWVTGAC